MRLQLGDGNLSRSLGRRFKVVIVTAGQTIDFLDAGRHHKVQDLSEIETDLIGSVTVVGESETASHLEELLFTHHISEIDQRGKTMNGEEVGTTQTWHISAFGYGSLMPLRIALELSSKMPP